MNKSVVGFVVGIVIIALGVGAYMLTQSLNEKADEVARESRDARPTDATPARPATPTPAEPKASPDKGELAPPPAAPTPPPAPATSGTDANVTIARVIGENGEYTPGGTVDVTLRLEATNGGALRALGIEENCPPAFTLDGFVGANRPDVPRMAQPGELEFAWITMPEFPYEFTYRLKVPEGYSDEARFSGQALYRTDGDEIRSAVVETSAKAGPPATPEQVAAMKQAESATAAATMEASTAAETTAPAESAPTETPAETEAPAAPEPAPAQEDNAIVTVERTLGAEGYTAGQPLDVTATINYDGTTPVMALSLVENLPTGWTFAEFTGGSTPAVKPRAGKGGVLTFIWIEAPVFPLTVSYKVNVPEGEQGERQILGESVYRRNRGEEKSPPAVSILSNL